MDESIVCRAIGAGEAADRLLEQVGSEYRAVNVGAGRYQFVRSYRPTWALAAGIVLLPTVVGALFLLVRTSETWTATVEEDHRRVQVRVQGRVLAPVYVAVRERLESDIAVDRVVAPLVRPAPPTAADLISVVPLAEVAPAPAPPAPSPVAPLQVPSATAVPVVAPPPPPEPIAVVPGADAAVPYQRRATPAPTAVPFQTPRADAPAPMPEAVVEPKPVPEPVVDAEPAAEVAPATGGWLAFDTGERQPLAPLVLVGRNPEGADDEDDAVLVSIADVDRSVSKTHLVVRSGPEGTWVADRGSTNGTAVVDAEGVVVPVPAGERVGLEPGQTVRFGGRSFIYEEATS